MLPPTLPRQLLRGTFTLSTGLAAYYFLENGYLALGVFAAGWTAVRVSTARLSNVWQAAGTVLAQHQTALDCNARIRIVIRIEGVVRSELVGAPFQRLKASGKVSVPTVEQWADGLLQRFRDRSGTSKAQEEVVFHVRGNHVWKNDKPWFQADANLYHDILIPDDAMRSQAIGLEDYRGLRIRLVVVNGIFKLQIGEFDESDTPESLGWQWRSWQTLTRFPLLYCPQKHHLPERLLNLDYAVPQEHSSKWQRNTLDKYRRRLDQDTACYRHVLTMSDGYDRRADKISDDFAKRFDDWIEREQFKFLGNAQYFANPYLFVEIQNLRDFNWYEAFSDWYEAFSEFDADEPVQPWE